MFDERIARFVLRPNMDGKDDKLILGCSFQSGRLKPGVVYEIVDFMGQIMIREVGESACKMTRPDSKGDSCWCNDAGHIINSGNHLMTTEEYDNMIYEQNRSEEEEINDKRKQTLDEIFGTNDNMNKKLNFL